MGRKNSEAMPSSAEIEQLRKVYWEYAFDRARSTIEKAIPAEEGTSKRATAYQALAEALRPLLAEFARTPFEKVIVAQNEFLKVPDNEISEDAKRLVYGASDPKIWTRERRERDRRLAEAATKPLRLPSVRHRRKQHEAQVLFLSQAVVPTMHDLKHVRRFIEFLVERAFVPFGSVPEMEAHMDAGDWAEIVLDALARMKSGLKSDEACEDAWRTITGLELPEWTDHGPKPGAWAKQRTEPGMSLQDFVVDATVRAAEADPASFWRDMLARETHRSEGRKLSARRLYDAVPELRARWKQAGFQQWWKRNGKKASELIGRELLGGRRT